MVQIVLVRPGSTNFDLQGRIQGTLDIPLSEQGHREALGALEGLRDKPLEAIYSSPCQAAMETAEVLARSLHLRLKRVEKLRNLDHGLWQGMCIEEVKQRQPKVYRQWQDHPETICPPEGEMLPDAAERVDAALEKLAAKHRHGVIALVVPEPLASLVHCRLTGENLCELWKTGSECGKWEVLQFNPGSLPAKV